VRGTFSKYPDPEALKLLDEADLCEAGLREAGLQEDTAQTGARPAPAEQPERSPDHDFEETRA
jgi:hypothetical protein